MAVKRILTAPAARGSSRQLLFYISASNEKKSLTRGVEKKKDGAETLHSVDLLQETKKKKKKNDASRQKQGSFSLILLLHLNPGELKGSAPGGVSDEGRRAERS